MSPAAATQARTTVPGAVEEALNDVGRVALASAAPVTVPADPIVETPLFK